MFTIKQGIIKDNILDDSNTIINCDKVACVLKFDKNTKDELSKVE
jgi:hypothetical protein